MTAYWLMYVFAAVGALGSMLNLRVGRDAQNLAWALCFVVLAGFVGLRDEVGADWKAYVAIYNYVYSSNLLETLTYNDPGYSLVNWLASRFNWGVHGVNLICAGIFLAGLIHFVRRQSMPLLALAVAMPVAVIMVSMGYTRQSVALGLVMVSLSALLEKKILQYLLWVLAAATFHRSAVLLAPLAMVVDGRGKIWNAAAVLGFGVLIYFSWAQERFDVYFSRYWGGVQQTAEGALFRVLMNALPAATFLVFQRKVLIDDRVRRMWVAISLAAIAIAAMLAASPSSVIVDRFSIYFIPIQMFVFATAIPNMVWVRRIRPLYAPIILGLYALVLWIWLGFGQQADAWLPYRSVLFS